MTNNPKNVAVNITFRNTEATDALKQYASEKVTHTLQKFAHQDTQAHVVLSVERDRHIAEVSFNTNGNFFTSKEETPDLYSSIDAVMNALSQQLRKHKEKMKSHHA